MSKIRTILKPIVRVRTWLSLIFILIMSIGVTALMIYIQPLPWTYFKDCIAESGFFLLVLNFLPVLLLMLTAFFIFNNVIVAIFVPGTIFVLMAVINNLKMAFRSDPFMPADLSLVTELFSVVTGELLTYVIIAVVSVIAAAILIFILANKIRCRNIKVKIRLPIAAGIIAIAVILNFTAYNNTSINYDLYVLGDRYNQMNCYNSWGFLYSFIYSANTEKIEKPEGYNSASVKSAISSFEATTVEDTQSLPHVVIIMSEAYSDLSENDHFSFEDGTDPMTVYNELAEDSISGHIVVPGVGGGTANTEFDVLTGLNTRYMRGLSYSYRLINRSFEGLTSILSQAGYYSIASHPGKSWFYNRMNAYNYMGFDEIYFEEAFDTTKTKGGYISDEQLFDVLIDQFDDYLSNDQDSPLFQFAVTIENHGTYGGKYVFPLVDFETDLDLEDSDYNVLANYFKGIDNANIELERYVNYLENLDEPVVLVFFGDHMPSLTDTINELINDSTDSLAVEERLYMYETPFLIWQNTAAKEIGTIDENYANSTMPDNMYISSSYLGAYVLELLGLDGLSPFMTQVNITREEAPVILEQSAFNMDGDIIPMPGDNEILKLYYYWHYYKIH